MRKCSLRQPYRKSPAFAAFTGLAAALIFSFRNCCNEEFTRWLELTYHDRVHTTLGMKPIDRFGLDLPRIRYLADNPYSAELFMLEDTRQVRADNTFSFNSLRYEPPRDMRGKTITIRHQRHTGFAPVVYQDGERLGDATLLDRVANDRRPGTDNF